MTRKSIIALLLFCSASGFAQTGGSPGSFSRLGFGARGIGMGNSMTAVSDGDISTYYNPALSAFSEQRTAAASFGILSLDRSLNFLSYTQSINSQAGISLGIINAGVSKIDGRDGDGVHTEDYSTSENQFYLNFSNRVHPSVSLGVSLKLLYSKLFEEVKSTTVGFDVGAYVQATEQLSIGVIIQDINSKYKWDTKAIYDQSGKTTEDKFPMLRRIGIAYKLLENSALISLEFENTSDKTNSLRFGAEYTFMENFTLRGGLDRWLFGGNETGAKPSFGFTVKNSLNGWTPAINYAFVIEPFSPHGMHIITVSANF